jgi:hypothetical protein
MADYRVPGAKLKFSYLGWRHIDVTVIEKIGLCSEKAIPLLQDLQYSSGKEAPLGFGFRFHDGKDKFLLLQPLKTLDTMILGQNIQILEKGSLEFIESHVLLMKLICSSIFPFNGLIVACVINLLIIIVEKRWLTILTG